MSGVRYEVAAGVATLTMDEPENRNALSPSLVDGLGDGLSAAVADGAVRAIVLTGEGGTFCAGADLRPAGGAVARHTFPELLAMILDAPKPVVARIGGHCVGGGVGLAAACDLSIAAEHVRFGFTEVRLGVAPAMISVVCLPKLRRADAAELFLTGRRFPAARAAEIGLITRAVRAEELGEAVEEVLGELVAGGPAALAASKELLARVPAMDRDAAFAYTAELSQRLFGSPEAAEGISAFRERRPPRWVP
ncbi:enoyl-CoA hydratase-related protein [Streptosporangium sp. NPDC006013]|uniref:enoyl-CoA hydratase-related protein n=1 Tax=Streptosporangium sp. NPDC006013 TaxID=3155596 RepID=UPI0033BBBD9A